MLLYLRCYRAEDDSIGCDTSVGGVLCHVGLADGREPQQPQHTVGHRIENVEPHVETRRVDLVQLVEVAVDYCVLGQAVLQPRAYYDGLLYLLTRGCLRVCLNSQNNSNTQPLNNHLSGSPWVRQCQNKHSPTHTHPDHQLPPSITIHSILFVQFTCLTVLFHNLSPGPLWSSSWSETLYFILHTHFHPIIILFSQHMPIPSPSQPVLP